MSGKRKRTKSKSKRKKSKKQNKSKNTKKRSHKEAFKNDVDVEDYTIIKKHKNITNNSNGKNLIKKRQ